MKIELATLDDAAAVFDLQQCAYQTEAAIYDDPNIPPLLETLDQLRESDFAASVFGKPSKTNESSVRLELLNRKAPVTSNV